MVNNNNMKRMRRKQRRWLRNNIPYPSHILSPVQDKAKGKDPVRSFKQIEASCSNCKDLIGHRRIAGKLATRILMRMMITNWDLLRLNNCWSIGPSELFCIQPRNQPFLSYQKAQNWSFRSKLIANAVLCESFVRLLQAEHILYYATSAPDCMQPRNQPMDSSSSYILSPTNGAGPLLGPSLDSLSMSISGSDGMSGSGLT